MLFSSVDKSFSKSEAEKLILCLYPGEKYFSYIAFDPVNKLCKLFKSFLLNKTSVDLAVQLNELKEIQEELNFNYLKSFNIYLAPKFVLIPEDIYNTDIVEEIFSYSNELKSNEKLITNFIPSANTYIVFAIDKFTAIILENNFIRHSSLHSATVLMEVFMKTDIYSANSVVMIVIEDKKIQLFIKKNNKLVYYNIFNFKTPEDVLYYSLYISSQTGIDPLQDNYFINRFIDENDDILNLLKKYIKNLKIIHLPDEIRLSPEIREKNHLPHLNLISSILCE